MYPMPLQLPCLQPALITKADKMHKSAFYCLVILGMLLAARLVLKEDRKPVEFKPVERNMVVAELFTSQNCKACNDTNRYMHEISRHENTITLSCHVTYLNPQGWHDTLSTDLCTERQKQYQKDKPMLGSYLKIPELVINGKYIANATKPGQIREALENGERDKIALFHVYYDDYADYVYIDLPEKKISVTANIYIVGYKQEHAQRIYDGVNRGKLFVSKHPITFIQQIGQWDGHAKSMEYFLEDSSIKIAVFAQSPKNHEIVGAGYF
jgi:hypothetical protein